MKTLFVPALKQRYSKGCGITALLMVLKYFEKEISEKKIKKMAGGIKSYGLKTTDLAKVAKKLGFKVKCYAYGKMADQKAEIRKPSKQEIIYFIKRGVPVIITIRAFILFNEKYSSDGHFIVVNGYHNHKFCYIDPFDGREYKIKEDELLFAWFNNALNSSAYLLAIEPKR